MPVYFSCVFHFWIFFLYFLSHCHRQQDNLTDSISSCYLVVCIRRAAEESTAATAEIAHEVGNAELHAEIIVDRWCAAIHCLLCTIPASTIFKTADKRLILIVGRLQTKCFFGMLQGEDIIAHAGIGDRAVIVPSGRTVFDS